MKSLKLLLSCGCVCALSILIAIPDSQKNWREWLQCKSVDGNSLRLRTNFKGHDKISGLLRLPSPQLTHSNSASEISSRAQQTLGLAFSLRFFSFQTHRILILETWWHLCTQHQTQQQQHEQHDSCHFQRSKAKQSKAHWIKRGGSSRQIADDV